MIKQLKEFMKTNNMNQSELARYLNVGETQLNRWMRNRCKIGRAWTMLIKQKIDAKN